MEVAERASWDELVEVLTPHLSLRTFVIGHHITAADLVLMMPVLTEFAVMADFNKLQHPNLFRWINHIQHLPGIREEI